MNLFSAETEPILITHELAVDMNWKPQTKFEVYGTAVQRDQSEAAYVRDSTYWRCAKSKLVCEQE